MSIILVFYAAMALIIAIIFYFGYRANKKNAWRREEYEKYSDDDPLDPGKL